MNRYGNSLRVLLQKLFFWALPTADMRTRYIEKHASMFYHLGEKLHFQPRNFPSDPERISIGDNVKIASNVTFINHDQSAAMLNEMYKTNDFARYRGCIEIGNNVMIGTHVCICPDVRIGNNCVIGAGSVVTRDLPDNSVGAGIPCRVIGSFDEFVEKRRKNQNMTDDMLWSMFCEKRK